MSKAGFAFLKGLQRAVTSDDYSTLESLAEEQHLLPSFEKNIKLLREGDYETKVNQGKECILSNIFIYEIFLYKTSNYK